MIFWQRHPALLYGLFVYLGSSFAFQPSWVYLIPLIFLGLQFRLGSQLLFALILGLGVYFFVSEHVHYPAPDQEVVAGVATVEISDISQKIRFGTPCLKMQLKLQELAPHDEGEKIRNISCSMNWKNMSTRPQGGFLYEVKGSLKRIGDAQFIFTPASNASWYVKEVSYSLVELRFKAKIAFKRFLRRYLYPGEVRSFLEGLITGDFNDPILAQNLRRFGLQHIMVVSGFHFSLIAAFIAFILRFFASWKFSIIGLLVGTFCYLLFLGATPSITRAWISVTTLLVGKLCERRANGLNSLGIGLILLILYDPGVCFHLGFQLSFLATGAILLFYPLCDKMLLRFFPKRSASDVLAMTKGDRFGYFLLVFFRKSWALGLAVHLLMLPMALYSFHTFPLMGIFYNCFFPFLVSISLFLLCLACLFFWIPILASALFSLCYFLTDMTLTFVSHAPQSFDKTISIDECPVWILLLYLSAICFMGVLLFQKNKGEDSDTIFNYF